MQLPSDRNPESNVAAPVSDVIPVASMSGDDEEDTALLQDMLQDARKYLLSFSWCESITSSYFASGLGKILGIFLLNIATARSAVDPWEWIVVGDIPPAYLPLEDCKSRIEAFDTCLKGMQRWVDIAREGRPATPQDRVPPVNVPATPEWAENLDGRLKTLNELMRPYFE